MNIPDAMLQVLWTALLFLAMSWKIFLFMVVLIAAASTLKRKARQRKNDQAVTHAKNE